MTYRENIVTRFRIALILTFLTTGSIPVVFGQTSSSTVKESSGGTSGIRFSLDTNSHVGTYTYVPGQWGELHLRLENSGDAEQNLLCSTYFDKNPAVQYARQVWLPSRSRLQISHPIQFPKAAQDVDRSALVHSLLIEAAPGTEVLVRDDSGLLQHERSLLLTPAARNTGLVVGWKSNDVVSPDLMKLIVANRINQGLDNKVTLLADQFLPPDETGLKYLDHLILAENRLVDDLAALTAVRRWLHAGGRLWIMLDRTDPILLRHLFGDEFHGSVVDRVELTSVRVDKPPSELDPDGEFGNVFDFDDPVDLSRIVVSDMKVRNTVNGWPAAMTMTYGRGRVLITTLGPRGWFTPAPVIPRKAGSPPPKPGSEFAPISPMEDLAAWIFAEREPEALPNEALESFSREFVTYSVPTGTLIIGTMSIFLVLLVLAGILLWRRERLEHFGWIGSLMATLFGLVFVGIGVGNRFGVPETIASVYFAQAIGGTDDLRASGAMAVYRSEGGESLIQSTHGGELLPDLTDVEGSTCRMVTTDLGKFRWDGLKQPSGLKLYRAATSRSLSKPVLASATLDSQGVTGIYRGPSFAQADAILATRQGRIGVRMAADGQFTAGAVDVLSANQFLNATLLTDLQDRRRRILQRLFENQNWRDSLQRPQLMLWLNDWDHAFQFGEELQHQGDTLLMVPVEFHRPPAGTELTIPSPLLSYSDCQPPDGSSAAGFWDDDRREWQERTRPGTTWFNVRVPKELLPIQALQVQIEVAVSGLMGQIEILGAKDETIVSLGSIVDPVGTLAFSIDDTEVLTVSEKGELTLGVRAGVTAQEGSAETGGNSGVNESAVAWKIESLSLQLRARTIEVSEED